MTQAQVSATIRRGLESSFALTAAGDRCVSGRDLSFLPVVGDRNDVTVTDSDVNEKHFG